MRAWRADRWVVATACAGVAVFLAGCGGSSQDATTGTTSGTTAAAAATVSATPPASGCGSFTAPPVKDDSGVIAQLPKEYGDAYANLHVQASKWAAWKPQSSGPFKVAVVWPGLVNPFISDLLDDIKGDLQASGQVGDIEVTNTGNNLDIPQQLQQMDAAIRGNPDLIVIAPLQPEAFKAAIDRAGAQGIPVVTALGAVDTPYAVNIDANNFLVAAQVTSVVARAVEATGNLLTVEGYPGTTINQDGLAGVDAVLKNCPQMKKVGSVTGAFVNSTAKASVTQFLATHPQPVGSVVQLGGMGPGVIQAFQGVGRPVPGLGDIGASNGSLAYWNDNLDTFRAGGSGQSAPGIGQAVSDTVVAMLGGGGVKVNMIVPPPALITTANLDQWVKPGATLQTPGLADGPKEGAYMPAGYLTPLFNQAPSSGEGQ